MPEEDRGSQPPASPRQAARKLELARRVGAIRYFVDPPERGRPERCARVAERRVVPDVERLASKLKAQLLAWRNGPCCWDADRRPGDCVVFTLLVTASGIPVTWKRVCRSFAEQRRRSRVGTSSPSISTVVRGWSFPGPPDGSIQAVALRRDAHLSFAQVTCR